MEYRTLGKTGLEVSVLGYGAWGIGQTMWIGADDDESLRALRAAIDGGVNFIDTATATATATASASSVRRCAAPTRAVYVATKIPPKNRIWPAPAGIHADEAFPADACRRAAPRRASSGSGSSASTSSSSTSGRTSGSSRATGSTPSSSSSATGRSAAFGVSINDHQPANAVALVRSGHVDTVQVIYNAFDQSPEDELFPAVQEANVGVIARVPFDEGGLTGQIRPDTEFPAGDFRNDYFRGDRKQEVWERVQALAADLGVAAGRGRGRALRFCLTHPAVSTRDPRDALGAERRAEHRRRRHGGRSTTSSSPRCAATAGSATSTGARARASRPVRATAARRGHAPRLRARASCPAAARRARRRSGGRRSGRSRPRRRVAPG